MISLKDVGSGYKRSSINENFSAIEDAINNQLLKRVKDNPSEDNQMMDVLDMNSFQIINLAPSGGINTNAVNRSEMKSYVDAIVGGATQPPSSGDGSGGGDTIIVEEQGLFYVQENAATAGQTHFFLDYPYTPNSNTLDVYINGVRQSSQLDYAETSDIEVTFNAPLDEGDRVVFRYSKTITAVPTNVYQTKKVRVFEDVVGKTSYDITYNAGALDVFYNGVKLKRYDDYTADNGSTVILTQAPQGLTDFVEIVAYADFSIADHYTKEEVYTKDETVAETEVYKKEDVFTKAEVLAAIASSSTATPAGAISAYGGSSAPNGYLLCTGQAISRVDYADLFAAIGTAYGNGNGVNTFNVPDLRGEFLRGADSGRGVDSGRTLGSSQTRSAPDEYFGCYNPYGSQDDRRRIVAPVPSWDGNFSTWDGDGDGSSAVPNSTDQYVDPNNNFTKGLKVNNMDTHTDWDNYPHNVSVNYIIKI